MIFTINRDNLIATIDSCGAQLLSVVANGKQRLWQNDDGSWNGHAPVLFPACGRTKTLVDGKPYDLPMHGFARRCEFVGRQIDASEVQFTLVSDGFTRAVYPFDWKFVITYGVRDNIIAINCEVTNVGDNQMYFSLGGHESFALDGDISDYTLYFPGDEKIVTLLHNEKGLLTGETQTLASGHFLPLPRSFMTEGRTVIIADVKSVFVQLLDKQNNVVAESRFNGFTNLLLWHPNADSKMVCIEPWLNLPDNAAAPATELSQKRGFVCLGGGESKRFAREIRYF